MDLFLKFLAYGGPAALALMGFIVVDKPPKTKRSKRIWYAAFIGAAFLSVGAGVWDSERGQSEIAAMFTGGDDYCFYYADAHTMPASATAAPLWLKCSGPVYNLSVWFSPLEAKGDPKNPLYWSLKTGQHFAEVIPGGFMSGISVKAGNYRIEMSARNGTVIETLELKKDGDTWSQSLAVFRAPGIKLHAERSKL